MGQLAIDCGNEYGSADRFNIARPHAQGIDPRSMEAVDVTANVAIGKYICPLDHERHCLCSSIFIQLRFPFSTVLVAVSPRFSCPSTL